ncbi:hypothetical protein JCM8208_003706 [Rhodotorula glutinis]
MAAASCGQSERDQEDVRALAAPPPVPDQCIRCKAPPTFVQRGTAYCHDCFRQTLTTRFTRALEGAKTVSAAGFDAHASPAPLPRRLNSAPTGKVVVAFSGGASSRSVLELLKVAHFSHLEPDTTDSAPTAGPPPSFNKKTKKHGLPKPPAFADCEVVWIDESSVTADDLDRHDTIADIVASSTPFRFKALKIEDAFSTAHSSTSEPLVASTSSASLPVASSPSIILSSSSPKEQLDTLLATLSPTSRDSLLASLRHTLLLSHARTTGASVLLLGSTGTRLAVDMLSGMASGRGWSAGEEIGAEYVARPADGGDEGRVLVVRPLALVSLREARHLCDTAGLRHVDPPPAPVGREADEKETSAKGRTVRSLVDDFVLSLDASFPSTAQTVLRTAHKLGQRSSSPNLPLCALCGLPAQPAADEWRKAITIADLIGAKAALEDEASRDVQLPEGKGGIRAPYAPSAAHLVGGDGAPEPDRAPAAGPGRRLPPSAGEDESALAPHLCYGCLLVLQEPGSAPVVKGRTRADELVLPPYVRDAVLARQPEPGPAAQRSAGEQRDEVVGEREVHGVEAMRKEVEEFLLEDEA